MSEPALVGGRPASAPRDASEIGWRAYWEELPERRIFAVEAADYVSRLDAGVGLHRDARVLDFGCGFGMVAALVAPRVRQLFAWDAAAHMRHATRRRLADHCNARVLDEFGPGGAGVRFDLILVNSVVQYMTPPDFDEWLVRWSALLAPAGRLVLSDVITARASRPVGELVEFVALATRRRVLLRTLWDGLSALRRYTRTRSARPLRRLDPDELAVRAAALGLTVSALDRNLAYRSGRSTLVLTPAVSGGRR
jgi:SAM-dependent methyltransferase